MISYTIGIVILVGVFGCIFQGPFINILIDLSTFVVLFIKFFERGVSQARLNMKILIRLNFCFNFVGWEWFTWYFPIVKFIVWAFCVADVSNLAIFFCVSRTLTLNFGMVIWVNSGGVVEIIVVDDCDLLIPSYGITKPCLQKMLVNPRGSLKTDRRLSVY